MSTRARYRLVRGMFNLAMCTVAGFMLWAGGAATIYYATKAAPAFAPETLQTLLVSGAIFALGVYVSQITERVAAGLDTDLGEERRLAELVKFCKDRANSTAESLGDRT